MEKQKVSRRDIPLGLTSLAMGLGVAWNSIIRANASEPEASNGLSHDAEAIHQEVLFAAKRKHLYEALLTANRFDKVSRIGRAAGDMHLASTPTRISPSQGGAFVLFGGYIVGRQLELVPNQRIVQAWREVNWDPGIYSIAKFELTDQDAGTKLLFEHTGFPKGAGPHLASGWYENYWGPLKKFLA
jgi:activator of HSP90 ATPase